MSEKKKTYNYDNEIKELSNLEEQKIKLSIETISGYRNLIRINIDKSLINSKLIDKDEEIIFILLIKYNHPITAPLLYCLTKFSVPELCDGRDFLEEVLSTQWIPKRKNSLKKIINLIPNFINNYLQKISEQKGLKIIGKFYLDNCYELSVLKLFPHLYFGDVIEIVAFGNDKRVYDEKRLIMITEGFILLFVEKSIFETQKLKLIFWGPINSLSLIKEINERNVIELKWKAKKDNTSLMRLKTPKDEEIFEILVYCLTKKKIEFKMANETSGGKRGEIPQIDIVAVEQEISKLEIKIKIKGKDGSNVENTKQLMNLYEKAVQYYSALNDYRYQIYMRKTKKLFSQMSEKELGAIKGIKKIGEGGEKKKKGKKGKSKKDKKDKKEIKNQENKSEQKINNEDKGKNEKEKEENKGKNEKEKEEKKVEHEYAKKEEIKQEKKEEEKKEEIKQEKNEDKNEDKKEEIKQEKNEDKKGDKKEEIKQEKNEDKKGDKKEEIKQEKIEDKKEDKNEEKREDKKEDKKEDKQNN